nr:uncharacterized protein LOC103426925 isoform X2 [Malus domestica]
MGVWVYRQRYGLHRDERISPPPLSLPTLSLSEWLEEKRRRRRGKYTIAYRSKVRVSEGHLDLRKTVRFGGRGRRGWIRSLRTHMRTWMNRLLSSCSASPCLNKRLINLFLLWTKNVKVHELCGKYAEKRNTDGIWGCKDCGKTEASTASS